MFGLQMWNDSVEAYQKGLEIEPDNKLLQDGLRDAEAARSGPGKCPSQFAIVRMNLPPHG